ncbi:hypothetical protein, partial [Klebsiella aerogenes]
RLLHPAPETWHILLFLSKRRKYCWDLVPRTGHKIVVNCIDKSYILSTSILHHPLAVYAGISGFFSKITIRLFLSPAKDD